MHPLPLPTYPVLAPGALAKREIGKSEDEWVVFGS